MFSFQNNAYKVIRVWVRDSYIIKWKLTLQISTLAGYEKPLDHFFGGIAAVTRFDELADMNQSIASGQKREFNVTVLPDLGKPRRCKKIIAQTRSFAGIFRFSVLMRIVIHRFGRATIVKRTVLFLKHTSKKAQVANAFSFLVYFRLGYGPIDLYYFKWEPGR